MKKRYQKIGTKILDLSNKNVDNATIAFQLFPKEDASRTHQFSFDDEDQSIKWIIFAGIPH